MDELRDASMLLMDAAGPWLRTALESAVDALPAAVQCQGVEGLHALAALPETLEMATAEEYSAALYDAGTATIAAGTCWMQLLSLLGRPCIRLLHVVTLAITPTARDAALHLGREAWAAAVLVGREAWAQPQLIAAAAAALMVLLLAWRLVAWLGRRRYIARASATLGRVRCAVRRRYESFLQGTRRRSQWLGWVLATSLPHAGYVLGCVAAVRVAERAGVRARLQPLLWGATPLLTTYTPAARTLLSLNVAADTQHWLRFWVVWACACCAAARSLTKCHPWPWPSWAPAVMPPQGAPGGPGRLRAARDAQGERPGHWAPRHRPRCSSQSPPKPPIPPAPVSTQARPSSGSRRLDGCHSPG